MARPDRQRLWARVLALGAAFLAWRAITMITEGALDTLVPWVGGLLVLELGLDVVAFVLCVRWAWKPEPGVDRWPLRIAASVVFLHAFRVLVFVLGRTHTLWNFDIRPEAHPEYAVRGTSGEVWFAGILAALSVIGVFVVASWRSRHRGGTPFTPARPTERGSPGYAPLHAPPPASRTRRGPPVRHSGRRSGRSARTA